MKTGCLLAAMTLVALMGMPAANAAPRNGDAPASALPFSGQISGTVFTRTRGIVGSASVVVVGSSGERLYGTSTDEHGRYAVKGLEKDDYAILVMDPSGTLLRKGNVKVRPLFRNLVDFVTEPPGAPEPLLPRLPEPPAGQRPQDLSVTTTLVTKEGLPISEAWVNVVPLQGEAPSQRARSDPRGNVRLAGLSTGYYRITARALGHVTWSLGPLLLEGGGEKSLKLILLPFPLGHREKIENLLVPVEPATPDAFAAETRPEAVTTGDTPPH
jgi:hypothetical protein